MVMKCLQFAMVAAAIVLVGCQTPSRRAGQTVDQAVQSATSQQALTLINAICRYRAERGVWPDSMETLVSGLSPALPVHRVELSGFDRVEFQPQPDDTLVLILEWVEEGVPCRMNTHLQVPEDEGDA
jgi:hypothetical protein